MPPLSLQRCYSLKIVVLTVFGSLLAWHGRAITGLVGAPFGGSHLFLGVTIQPHRWQSTTAETYRSHGEGALQFTAS
jgi:hypothetical protein